MTGGGGVPAPVPDPERSATLRGIAREAREGGSGSEPVAPVLHGE